VHRDIKLDNILIKRIEEKENYEVRIADFGLATFTPNDELIHHKCGSPGYVAPEIFKKEGYSYKVDIFSLGSVLFNLLTGRYLFSADCQQDLLIKNIKCQTAHIIKYLKNNSEECRDLLFRMIDADPAKRPSANEALMHDWFNSDKCIIVRLL
jgi:calcium/calmodulin-dependent protein kinase I